MNSITRNELDKLVQVQDGVCISLFMPLENEPDKADMNRIRLKNSIKQAKELLAKDNFLPSSIEEKDTNTLLDTAENLFAGLDIERGQAQGLAIFISPDIERTYFLPISLEEQVMVGPRFYIKPLLPMLDENGRFYLLTLSQKSAKLWHGTQFDLEQIEVPQLPAGMEEALALEDPERSLQFHTSTGQSGDRAAIHHGHEDNTEKKGAILRYFREVNKAIMEGLSDEKAPLFVAAVDYLGPIYKEANTYPHLMEQSISGNPDELNKKDLHNKAWETADPHFEEARKKRTNLYEEVAGTENSSHDVDEILPAAAYGRVDTLFIPKTNGHAKWGQFNEDSGQIETCPEATYKCDDLYNLAAIKTLQNGGKVYAVETNEMPDDAEIAAIFRYAIS